MTQSAAQSSMNTIRNVIGFDSVRLMAIIIVTEDFILKKEKKSKKEID
jgi:hypothetical protein